MYISEYLSIEGNTSTTEAIFLYVLCTSVYIF